MSTAQPMTPVVPIGGTLACLLITAMFLTSFDWGKDWMRSLHPKA